jgi:ABC-type multidrug transport system fused ATPase/permease subunit
MNRKKVNFLTSALPFIGMFLIKHSINMLTLEADFEKYLSIIIILLISSFIIALLQSIVTTKSGILGNMIGDKLFRNIFNKTMEIDYEMLLDKKILEKRELAMKVIEQGRFNPRIGKNSPASISGEMNCQALCKKFCIILVAR